MMLPILLCILTYAKTLHIARGARGASVGEDSAAYRREIILIKLSLLDGSVLASLS